MAQLSVSTIIHWINRLFDGLLLSGGVDYLFDTTELSLQQRSNSQCFDVTIIPDDLLETSETFQLTLSSNDPAIITGGSLPTATITILNDDSEDHNIYTILIYIIIMKSFSLLDIIILFML